MASRSILTDLGVTVTSSAAEGGKFAEIAEAELVPLHLTTESLGTDLTAAKKIAMPLEAAVDAARRKSEDTIQFVYDLTWNRVGRPAIDPKLSILFPGGASQYLVGDAQELPDRMELCAELFQKGVHPKLSEAHNKEAAEMLLTASKEHRDAITAARLPMAKVVLVERTLTAMARLAQVTLANFKRLLKVAGYNEAQIHEIIPSHALPTTKKAATKKAKEAAAKEAAAKEAAAKETSAKETSAKETSAKETSAKETSAKETSAKETSAKEGAPKEASAKETTAKAPAPAVPPPTPPSATATEHTSPS